MNFGFIHLLQHGQNLERVLLSQNQITFQVALDRHLFGHSEAHAKIFSQNCAHKLQAHLEMHLILDSLFNLLSSDDWCVGR